MKFSFIQYKDIAFPLDFRSRVPGQDNIEMALKRATLEGSGHSLHICEFSDMKYFLDRFLW